MYLKMQTGRGVIEVVSLLTTMLVVIAVYTVMINE